MKKIILITIFLLLILSVVAHEIPDKETQEENAQLLAQDLPANVPEFQIQGLIAAIVVVAIIGIFSIRRS